MISASPHRNEEERLRELNSYSILDTLPEESFDNLTAIAAEICGTPISLVSLIDQNRQWFKSHHGLDAKETPRDQSFCAHAIHDPDRIFIVEDARKDERFHDNPLVTHDPDIAFYAGIPLKVDDGLPLGTLCVIDTVPRKLTENQKKSLKALGDQVVNLFKLRKSNELLREAMNQLDEKNKDLERFASIAAHDIKSPLSNIIGMSDIFLKEYQDNLDDYGVEMINTIQGSSKRLNQLVEGLLEYTRNDAKLSEGKTDVLTTALSSQLKDLFKTHSDVRFNIETSIESIHINRTAINQILINLISNAIKYNDKESTVIDILLKETDGYYRFQVKDNGPGIPQDEIGRLFQIFEVNHSVDKFGKKGSGIGLATVKKLVEAMGGSISVNSVPNQWTEFTFSIPNS